MTNVNVPAETVYLFFSFDDEEDLDKKISENECFHRCRKKGARAEHSLLLISTVYF